MERLSHCPLDCPDACSLTVEVEGDRVVAVDGDHRNPLTDGFICSKVRALPDHLYGSERLLEPGIRVGPKGEGRFRSATWDEALDLIARRIDAAASEFGGEAILPLSYGGSNGALTQDTTDARLFRRLGASNIARNVCAVPTGMALMGMYGKMPGVSFSDFEHAQLIVIWGCNPNVTGIHLLSHVQEARRRGAKLVVVDPRRNRLAHQADLHLAVRPGTDVAVALAVANWLFENDRADLEFLSENARQVEEFRRRASDWPLDRAASVAGVTGAEIEALASLYADSSPAVIRAGWGMERNRNGCSSVAAVLALPAVAGKFGVLGGGYLLSNGGALPLDATRAANAAPTAARTINLNRIGRALLETDDPPVKVLFVYNCNPASILPDQERVLEGLRREDLFTVVFEQVMTDSALYADVVLPATVFLEHTELRSGYGALVVQQADAVVRAAGEARPNYEVFDQLCERLDLSRDDDPHSPDELSAAILDDSALREPIARAGIAILDCNTGAVQFGDLSPRTPDGKVHLVPESLDDAAPGGLYAFRPDPGTEAHPLALVSPATSRRMSSTFGQLHRGQVALSIHPDDAASRGIIDGMPLRVYNQIGEMHCLAKITGRVRAGVVFMPKGLWKHNTLNGRTTNALVPDDYSDVGDGACFNDARVEVAPLEA